MTGNTAFSVLRHSLLWAVLITTAFVFTGSFVRAAETPSGEAIPEAAPETRNDASYMLAPVTVTAQKREENVQDVPVSMSVVPGVLIDQVGIQDAKELMRFVPNVYVKDVGGLYQTIIRGNPGFPGGQHTAAAYYVDDVNIPLSYMQNPDLIDVERVEVLKGPQGVLYGRNSESGVINIVTRKPGNELRGRIFTEYNSYDTKHGMAPGYQVGGNISLPLAQDKLYAGFAGLVKYTEGPMKNMYKNDDRSAEYTRLNGRFALRATPTEQWDISLMAEGVDNDGAYGIFRFYDGPYKSKRGSSSFDGPARNDYWGNMETLRVEHKGDTVHFISITGRNYYRNDMKYDYEMTELDLALLKEKNKDTLWSQELRLSSATENSPLQWLVGLYGFTEDIDSTRDEDQYAFGTRQLRKTETDMHGLALFGQATWTIAEKLHLTGGLRYDYTRIKGRQDYSGASPWTGDFESSYSKSKDNGEWLPKFSIGYDFTDGVMGYATVSRGYLAGGVAYASATSKDTLLYDPEYTWNYEIGLKTSWLDNRLIINAAAFYIDMEDKQVAQLNSSLQAAIENAAEARAMGFEIELTARPLPGWEIFGGFGYTDTEITKWKGRDMSTGAAFNYKNKKLTYAPEYTFNIGTQYHHESGFFGRMDLLGTGSYYYDFQNSIKESDYLTVNVKAGYARDNWELSLWCKNIFDEGYGNTRVDYGALGLGRFVIDGEPRQFGATLSYTF